jgi:glycerol-3-phosphate acyltransferase PlsX
MTQDIRVDQIDNNRVVLSIDAMGGDLGPPAVVAGIARSAAKDPNLYFILHGP